MFEFPSGHGITTLFFCSCNCEFNRNSDIHAQHVTRKTLFRQITLMMPVTLDWIGEQVRYSRLLMIPFCAEWYNVDQWKDSNCTTLTHFSGRKTKPYKVKHIIKGRGQFPTVHCDFLPSFAKTVSTESSRAKMSQRSSPKRPKGLKVHTLFGVFVPFFSSLRLKALSCVYCGLIKSSPGFSRGTRMCLLQHFYAMYNVQFVVLIEPSRPLQIAASALSNPLEIN